MHLEGGKLGVELDLDPVEVDDIVVLASENPVDEDLNAKLALLWEFTNL